MLANRTVGGKRGMDHPFRKDFEGGDQKSRKKARERGKGETGQKQIADVMGSLVLHM